MGYAFGDTGLAARRLALLADTFADSSRTFLRESVHWRPRKAADLGCGPGYSTQLLAETVSADYTVGLDNSESFLRLAQESASERLSFLLHDITTGPFPSGPFDLLFSRFELTHLREPDAVVMLWGEQLNVHGLLLIEEVERVETNIAVLRTYLDMQQAMLRDQGNCLFIGPVLDRIGDSELLKRRSSEMRNVRVAARRAAEMFHMNLGVWRQNEFVKNSYDQAELDGIESGLLSLSLGDNPTPVEWGLRQIVMERVRS